jgi:hypothetical protein
MKKGRACSPASIKKRIKFVCGSQQTRPKRFMAVKNRRAPPTAFCFYRLDGTAGRFALLDRGFALQCSAKKRKTKRGLPDAARRNPSSLEEGFFLF